MGLRRILLLAAACLGLGTAPVMAQDDGTFLERLIQDSLSGAGREVRVTGFAGALSSTARLQSLTIADDDGIWLRLENAQLVWTRTALLRGRLEVETLAAERVEILRPPVPTETGLPPAETTEFALPDLPVTVNIGTVRIDRLSLAEPVLGQTATLAVDGAARLEGGGGALRFDMRRLDGDGGNLAIDLAYDPATRGVDLNVLVDEPANGIAANLMGLPGRPALTLSATGSGPVDDLTTRLALATDGVQRLGGTVTLTGAEDGGTSFAADLGGDITALFQPAYRPFFGPDVHLSAEGLRGADGSLTLDLLQLDAAKLRLEGQVALNAEGWPLALDIDAVVGDPRGGPVLLPLTGAETRIDSATLTLEFDAASGDRLTGDIGFSDLERDGLRIADMAVDLDGTIALPTDGPARLDTLITAVASGIATGTPGLDTALGDETRLNAQLAYTEGDRLTLSDLVLSGPDYGLTGSAVFSGLEDALDIAFDLSVRAEDMARFAGLAGRDLAGRVEGTARGRMSPIEGSFDIAATGTTQDLRLGVEAADAVLAGQTRLTLDATRGADGITLRRLSAVSDQAEATAQGRLAAQGSALTYGLRLSDVALVAPQFTGASAARGRIDQTEGGHWRTDSRIDGPYRLTLDLSGQFTGPGAALRLTADLPDASPLVPDLRGPLSLRATARPDGADWLIDATAQGAGGLEARTAGRIATDGTVDLTIRGAAPLSLSEPFLRPSSLAGTARYDLALRGQPGLPALSGRITTQGARFVAPAAGIALSDINARIDLQGARANLDVTAAKSTGGQVQVSGTLGLDQGLPANLRIALRGFTLVDPRLFRIVANADMTVTGPVSGGALIAGDVTLGESTVLVEPSALALSGEVPPITHVNEPAAVYQTRLRAGLAGQTEDAGTAPVYGLDVGISVPGRFFVRGRGLDAEVAGAMRVSGTTVDVRSEGAFRLVRGRVAVLGKRFDLTEGEVTMGGRLDPFLRFVATSTTRNGTASIVIDGPASAPDVRFVASPERPEDEVLALLFFGRNLRDLSTFQTLQLASAVATLAGRGGADLVGRLRGGLNLDDFDVVTDETGSAAVRAGKYISDNIYTDVVVGGAGTGEVSLNIDLTPSLTVRGSVGANDESSIGIFFERDY